MPRRGLGALGEHALADPMAHVLQRRLRMVKTACLVLGTALFVATMMAGCGECNDCGGQCVLRESDHVGGFLPGADESGTVVLELSVYEEGSCHWEKGTPFWLRYDAGAFSVQAPSGALDTSMIDADGERFTYTDRDLVVEIDYTVDPPLITLTEGAKVTNVECVPEDPTPVCSVVE